MWLRRNKRQGDSKRALDEANKNLERVKARQPEVIHESTVSRKLREANHFAEQILELMRLQQKER